MGVRQSGFRSLALIVGTTTLWATACGGGGDSGSMLATRLPSPSTATPPAAHEVGPPTTLPWWSAGELHVGKETIRTRMHDIVTRGGTTLVGGVTTHGSTWLIQRGDRLVPMVTTHPWGTRPVLSANGLHAAWTVSTVTRRESLYEADQAFTVTAYDVRRGAVVGSTVIGSHTTCCDGGGAIDVVGVDDDGTVVIERYADRGWTWHPGAEPVELGATVAHGLDSADQWPQGVSWTIGGSSDDPAGFARVSSASDLQRIGRVPQSQGGVWSPDGSSYAYQPFSKFARYPPVVWSRHGRVRLHVRSAVGVLAWEGPHSVILLATSTGSGAARRSATLARCDAESGSCERAGPVLHHVVLPDLAG